MKIKKIVVLVLRLALASGMMLIAYMVSTMLIGDVGMVLTPEEQARSGLALVLVAIGNALVLAFPILRARWYGIKLVGAVVLVQFGVETFMTQIETWYFNQAVQMEVSMFLALVAAGALRAALFAPLAVWILGKMRKPAEGEAERDAVRLGWGWKLAGLAVVYAAVYFLFGYFVAWQFAEIRQFYTGSTAILPFGVHFSNFFLSEPQIIPFQLMRGAAWAGLGLLVVQMMRGSRWQTALAVALVFTSLLALPMRLFPNPYMPAMVIRGHYYELLSSMLLYGGITGWVWWRAEF